jgi:phosphatidylglycerophosphate synthase
MLTDYAVSLGLLAGAAFAALAYAVRVTVRGEFRSARVDAAGTSAFLGRFPQEMTYWVITPVVRQLVAQGVTANAVTTASLALGLGAGVALGFGHFGIGAALAAVSALCDALDGYVARETRSTSTAGELFDAAADRYNEFFFLGGLAIYYRESAAALLLVLCALVGSFMVSYASAKAEAKRVKAPRGSMRRAERAAYLTLACGLAPIFGAVAPSFTDAPVVLALLLVSVVANASTIRRLKRIAELAQEQQDEQQRERLRWEESTPTPVPATVVSPARDTERAALGSVASS